MLIGTSRLKCDHATVQHLEASPSEGFSRVFKCYSLLSPLHYWEDRTTQTVRPTDKVAGISALFSLSCL